MGMGLFNTGGSGSSRFDVKPLGVEGSIGGLQYSPNRFRSTKEWFSGEVNV